MAYAFSKDIVFLLEKTVTHPQMDASFGPIGIFCLKVIIMFGKTRKN